MTAGTETTASRHKSRGRRELTGLLLLGGAGAGIVLLALRQTWAKVVVSPPAPLPSSSVPVSGQSLVPAATALAIAALASLAAVLATRGVARRVTGFLTAILGLGTGLVAAAQVSAASALDAARQNLSAPGSATGAGSATGSGNGGAATLPVTGTHTHVVFVATGWRDLAVVGALALIAAGVLIVIRARDLPEMSARYERGPRRAGQPAGDTDTPADPARLWESLSAGEDPTR